MLFGVSEMGSGGAGDEERKLGHMGMPNVLWATVIMCDGNGNGKENAEIEFLVRCYCSRARGNGTAPVTEQNAITTFQSPTISTNPHPATVSHSDNVNILEMT